MKNIFKLFFSFSFLISLSFADTLTILEQIKVNETTQEEKPVVQNQNNDMEILEI